MPVHSWLFLLEAYLWLCCVAFEMQTENASLGLTSLQGQSRLLNHGSREGSRLHPPPCSLPLYQPTPERELCIRSITSRRSACLSLSRSLQLSPCLSLPPSLCQEPGFKEHIKPPASAPIRIIFNAQITVSGVDKITSFKGHPLPSGVELRPGTQSIKVMSHST